MLKTLISARILKRLQQGSGLFKAAENPETGYDKAWIRDCIYAALGLEQISEKRVLKTYHALFDLMLRHEYKIDHAIIQKPDAAFKYIHARFDPLTFEEFHEEWGNKQNDAIGLFLFKAGDLTKKGFGVIRNKSDIRILQKLVCYLSAIEYWNDKDNGIWENDEEVHASSVGACVAGLKQVRSIVCVPKWLIKKGQDKLNELLPNESESKKVDLALLSLIYPYNVVTPKQRDLILWNVETQLVRKNGIIRYFGDWYYNNGTEAEWCFGFPWLAKIHKDLGNIKRYKHYIRKTKSVMTWKGEIPELYLGNINKCNTNTPLAWAQAMYLCAINN